MKRRIDRLNSLLKEVIAEVISREVENPHIARFVSITNVSITPDLRHAKIFVSVIGSSEMKKKTVEGLQSAAGFIAVHASKKVVMHHFPALSFQLDDSVEKHLRIEELLDEISKEKEARDEHDTDSPT